ncbi:Uncharacterised protein [Mycolicibacterium phlei]|jgi:hypothetical protein|uniref:Secreted protein n=1 Tax=Mycolicibacterium phlei DSM 43239 = CCUG 21000 TaxID=1226750 RepID=A0A5N5UQK2_MYCPH|nr:hypothetical protein [Mycolicibacterium phlei]VEG08347.1 Uncharacterised protein [Mycobacteroides chelonae]AMO60227.1 hypothetical protein MPHLCCUG_01402 [Mycolicibacterium phlei]EID16927.1 hypothetical protein MPHLEI_05397 [Mycolicibacterium phlei RIVM601174]KAB7751874.1 hypothetical protein MPHL21000_24240 [Mycolicibacterium phlei DSM 43239 = CCUG 21000]KXW60030.1 hypothetical protein MPHL43070_25900 [Mycolicibacterium phlei DSM 43070]
MRNVAKTAKTLGAGTVLGGSLLFTAGLGMALAQPGSAAEKADDGRVNVTVGTAGVLEDVELATAAQIAAGVCDIDDTSVAALAKAADTEGTDQTVCTNSVGTIVLQQNLEQDAHQAPTAQTPGASHEATGHESTTAEDSATDGN